jgi:hypothetical protein
MILLLPVLRLLLLQREWAILTIVYSYSHLGD